MNILKTLLKVKRSKYKAILRTWFITFLAFELGIHYTDLFKKDVVVSAFCAALVPVLIRWLDPRDKFPDGD